MVAQVELRPLRVVEILDRAFKVVKENLQALMTLALIPAVFTAASHVVGPDHIGLMMLFGILGAIAGLYINLLYLFILADGWHGSPSSISSARERTTFGLAVRWCLLSVWVAIIGGLLLLLLIIPGLIYLVNRTLAYTVLVLEGCSISEALSNSKMLMTGERWYKLSSPTMRLGGLWIILMVIWLTGYVLIGALAVPFISEAGIVSGIAQGAQVFFQSVLSCFGIAALIGFYYDLRNRYEGHDLSQQISQLS
ncbi:MAG: hypothetical protein K1X83_05545 [Oligoflexia bacterium]|nr:hypothetical protein [Oligoflexia bacterium]